MARFSIHHLLSLKRVAVALFALAQLIPSGFAFASDSEGFSFVICTADGEKTVTWAEYVGEEFVGEPSPFETTPDESEHNPCHACVTSCRGAAAIDNDPERLTHPSDRHINVVFPEAYAALVSYRTAPPMPSRAPPISLT